MKILGIDPGSRHTGFALIVVERLRVIALEAGAWSPVIRSSRAASLADLALLAEQWISDRRPDAAAVETVFHFKNARSALILAEARGALLAVLGRLGVTVFDYPPATVKKTICGIGHANKPQMRNALERTVPGLDRERLSTIPVDGIDALALAVCHSIHGATRRITQRG